VFYAVSASFNSSEKVLKIIAAVVATTAIWRMPGCIVIFERTLDNSVLEAMTGYRSRSVDE